MFGQKKRYEDAYRYVRIIPQLKSDSSPSVVSQLLMHISEYRRSKKEELLNGPIWFRYLIHRQIDGSIDLFFGFPEDRTTGIKTMLKMNYPELELSDVMRTDLPLQLNDEVEGDVSAGCMIAKSKELPFEIYKGGTGLEDILFAISVDHPFEAWVDFLVSYDSNRILKRSLQSSLKNTNQRGGSIAAQVGLSAADFKAALYNQTPKKSSSTAKPQNNMTVEEKERQKNISKRLTSQDPHFKAQMKIMIHGFHSDSVLQTVSTTIKSIVQSDNSLHMEKSKRYIKEILSPAPIPTRDTILMNSGELGHFIRLPHGDHSIYQKIAHIKPGQRLLGDNELNNGIHIGMLEHPVKEKRRSVKIPYPQFQKHFFVSGKTGSGKSSLIVEILNDIMKDFVSGKESTGFTLFDPAEETAATILNRLRQFEAEGHEVDWSKVHYFSFSKDSYVLPMNLLHHENGDSIYDIADYVLELITAAYGPAIQMERVLRNSLITLLSDPNIKHSILGIIPLLSNERFRVGVQRHVEDYLVQQFWKTEFIDLAENQARLVGPLLNRLSPMQTNADMRRMFGYHEMRLNIRKWMDEGHIVLFNLKGVSEQGIKMAGGYIINNYHLTAQKRGTGAKTHVLLMDEAHRTQYPIVNKIFAEDRKFGLTLGLATQFLSQMDKEILENIRENVGNIFSARQGPESAVTIAKISGGMLDSQTLQNLPDNRIAIYTQSLVKNEKKMTSTIVRCDPPYVYKLDGVWANHENKYEMHEAFQWGLSKGKELLLRDGVNVKDIDSSILHYLKKGTPKVQCHEDIDNTDSHHKKPQMRNWS